MTNKGPHRRRKPSRDDELQAALQVDAFVASDEQDTQVLQYADDAMVSDEGDAKQDKSRDEHEWDDVVQQTFPASDAPPPPGPKERK